MTTTSNKKIKPLFLNIAFIVFGAVILFFLFNAPKETTKKLPKDLEHSRFQEMGKKEAEKFCTECHSPKGVYPLPEKHPPSIAVFSAINETDEDAIVTKRPEKISILIGLHFQFLGSFLKKQKTSFRH
jgi:hypothetical protein